MPAKIGKIYAHVASKGHTSTRLRCRCAVNVESARRLADCTLAVGRQQSTRVETVGAQVGEDDIIGVAGDRQAVDIGVGPAEIESLVGRLAVIVAINKSVAAADHAESGHACNLGAPSVGCVIVSVGSRTDGAAVGATSPNIGVGQSCLRLPGHEEEDDRGECDQHPSVTGLAAEFGFAHRIHL